MTRQEAKLLIDLSLKQKPITDACAHCGTSRRELRVSNYKGCRFCRSSKSDSFSGPIGAEQVPICSAKEWLDSKDREWAGRGGFSAFCKNYNLNEQKHREEAANEHI